MKAKKDFGEIVEVKRAIRALKREINEKQSRILKLHPIKDRSEIDQINTKILKKEKQKMKLEKKLV